MLDLNPLEFQTLCRLVVGAVLVLVMLVALGTAGGAGEREETTREVLRGAREPLWKTTEGARPCGVCGRPMASGEAVACAACWEGCEVEATRDDTEGEK